MRRCRSLRKAIMTATIPNAICDAVAQALPMVKHGSLRVWGKFFGRPYDNIHQLVGCSPLVDGVQFTFDEGETLTVWHPSRWDISPARFEILEASRVRWEWFYYGREKSPENRYHIEWTACGDVAAVSTNVDWFQTSSEIRRQGAAAELL